MIPFEDWFPLTFSGTFLIVFGGLKLYGLYRGIEGGAGKPFAQKLCGT